MINKINEGLAAANLPKISTDGVIWAKPPFYDTQTKNFAWEETDTTYPNSDPRVSSFFENLPEGWQRKFDENGFPYMEEIPKLTVTSDDVTRIENQLRLQNSKKVIAETNTSMVPDIFETLTEDEQNNLRQVRQLHLAIIESGGELPATLDEENEDYDDLERTLKNKGLISPGKFSLKTEVSLNKQFFYRTTGTKDITFEENILPD